MALQTTLAALAWWGDVRWSMVGLVTTRDLIVHPYVIVHEFGARCYLRCIWRSVTAPGRSTFLECMECAPATPVGIAAPHPRLGARTRFS